MKLPALLAAIAAGLVVAVPAATADPTPKTSLSDVEDEVMCPICGALLELSDSPQARREKAYIAGLIATGKTKTEIEDALVAQYGRGVLALPEPSGFDLSAYLAPAIAFLVAAAALAAGVLRWRRAARPAGSKPAPEPGPRGEDAERLEADLDRYDL